MFSKDEQRIAFAKYYEYLSIPKEELFDNSYVNLCNISVLKEVGAFLISRILLKVLVRKEDINSWLFLRCSALISYSSLLLFVFIVFNNAFSHTMYFISIVAVCFIG
jgi:hypothetical protein